MANKLYWCVLCILLQACVVGGKSSQKGHVEQGGVLPADPARTEVSLSRDDTPADGVERCEVRVRLRDASGGAPKSGEVRLVAAAGQVAIDRAAVTSNAAGEAVFSLTAREAGTALLNLIVPGPAGPVTLDAPVSVAFVQAQPDPGASSVTFSNTVAVLADGLDAAHATVTLKTAAGGIPYHSEVALLSDDPGIFSQTAAIDDQGVAHLDVRSRRSGAKTMRAVINRLVTLAARPVVNFQEVAVNVDLAQARLDRTSAQVGDGDGDEAIVISVLVPTITGGYSSDPDIQIEVSGTGNQQSDIIDPQVVASRIVRLRSTKAEQKTVTITITANSKKMVIDPPPAPTFTAGPVDPARVTLSFENDATSLTAPPLAATLQSTDRFGNPHTGLAGAFTADSGIAFTSSAAGPLDGDGKLVVKFTATQLGERSIAATVGGATVQAKVRVVAPWVAAAPDISPVVQVSPDPTNFKHTFFIRDGAVGESDDDGLTFTPITTGISTATITRLAVHPKAQPLTLWASSADTVYRRQGTGAWVPMGQVASGHQINAIVPDANPNDALILARYCNLSACTSGSTNSYYYKSALYWVHDNALRAPIDPGKNLSVPQSGVNRSEDVTGLAADLSANGRYYYALSATDNDGSGNKDVASEKTKVYDAGSNATYTTGTWAATPLVAAASFLDRAGIIGSIGPQSPLKTYAYINGASTTLDVDHPLRGGNVSALAASAQCFAISGTDGLSPANISLRRSFRYCAGAWTEAVGRPFPNLPLFIDDTGEMILSEGIRVPTSGPALGFAARPRGNLLGFTPNGVLRSVNFNSIVSELSGGVWRQRYNGVAIWSAHDASGNLYGSYASGIIEASPNVVHASATQVGKVNQIFVQEPFGTQVLASTDNGIFRRKSFGDWEKLTTMTFGAIVRDPKSGDFYASPEEDTIAHYTGSSWENLSVSIGGVKMFVVDSREKGALYAIGTKAVFRKPPDSMIWSLFADGAVNQIDLSGLAAPQVLALQWDDNNDNRIYYATLDGTNPITWSQCKDAPDDVNAVAIDPVRPRHWVMSGKTKFFETQSACQ